MPVTITEAKPAVKASGKITPMAANVVPDPELKKTINNELGRAEDMDVTAADLESLNSIYYEGPYEENSTEPRLSSLEGLQYAINLNSFGFTFADFSNPDALAPIANLVDIEGIDIANCKLTSDSLHYFTKLVNLEYLHLPGNQIRSLIPLEPFLQGQLERYYATPHPEDFSFDFYFSRNPISDFQGWKTLLNYR